MMLQEQSQSQVSWAVVWKAHRNLPDVTSTAKTESLHKLGPGLVDAFQSAPGCCVATYAIPDFWSIAHDPPQAVTTPAQLCVPLNPKLPQSQQSTRQSEECARDFRLT